VPATGYDDDFFLQSFDHNSSSIVDLPSKYP